MSDSTPEWSKETLRKLAIMEGQKALGLADRDPRGIYVGEEWLFEWEWFGRLRCKLFGHREPYETEPLLNVHQQQIGTAEWCTRCGTVVAKDDELEPFGAE